MTLLEIVETEHTPLVRLDADTGMLTMRGRSLTDKVATFYAPVIDWVKQYAAQSPSATELELCFEYLNIDSSKQLLDLLGPLKDTKGLTVRWHHRSGDHAMKEMGEDLSELSGIPFVYVSS